MYHKILVPLDGSLFAEQALDQAVTLATTFDAELHLVQIVTNYLTAPFGMEYSMGETFRDIALREAHEYLEQVHQRLEGKVFKPIHTKVIEGLVAENIVDYADFQGCDLIAMATHGRGGIRRWVFGSVAERILHAAHCPILLIRSAEKITQKELVENSETIPTVPALIPNTQ